MRKLILFILLVVPMLVNAQIQLTAEEKNKALATAQEFCRLLSEFSSGGENYLDNDTKIFSLCENDKVTTFDDLYAQKDVPLNDYLSVITRDYYNKIKFTFTNFSISDIVPIPNFDLTADIIGSANAANPSDISNHITLKENSVADIYIVVSVKKNISSIKLNKSIEYSIIYSKVSGKILASINKNADSGPFVSMIKGLKAFSIKDYEVAKKNMIDAVHYDRFNDKTACCATLMIIYLKQNDYSNCIKYAKLSENTKLYNTAMVLNALRQEDWVSAVKFYHPLAEEGDSFAQGALGNAYYIGLGVAVDKSKAFYWLRKAIEQSNPIAQFSYALLGGLLEKNISKDQYLDLLRKSASSGYVPSYVYLGYELGRRELYSESFDWLKKSAEKGDALAMAMVGACYAEGTGTPENNKEALYWLKKSINSSTFDNDVGMSLLTTNNWPESKADIQEIIDLLEGEINSQNRTNSTSEIPNNNNTTVTTQSHTQQTTQRTSTNSNNNPSSSSRRYRNYTFNSPKGEPKLIGLSLGYVSKQWVYSTNERAEKYGFWDDCKVLHGAQIGIRVEPLFKYGFGINTGLFYEFYYSKSDTYTLSDDYGYYDCYGIFTEHSLYLPIHLEYRLNFSESFQIFFYGGVGLDCGIYASVDMQEEDESEPYYTADDVYDNEDWGDYNRFNASFDYGLGVRVKSVQLNVGFSKGLINMSNDNEYKTKQNKNWILSLSYMF